MINCSQEERDAVINLIQAELEESMKHGVEDIVVCVDQRTQGLCKDHNKRNNETLVDLKAVKTPLDKKMKSLQETLADMRNNLHKELDLMFQVKAKTTKALIETT
jgi:UTP-glucose-1-phosphate uridylyltransferase